MSFVFQRTGATHPLDGALRCDRRTGKPLLGITKARPAAFLRLLTPLRPPFYIEVPEGRSPVIAERCIVPQSSLVVAGVLLLLTLGLLMVGGSIIAGRLFAPMLGPLLAPLSAGVAMVALGLMMSRCRRIVRLDEDHSEVLIATWIGSMRIGRTIVAPLRSSAIRVHPVRFESRGDHWCGYGAVLHIGNKPKSGIMILAAFELEGAARAYIRDLPPSVKSLFVGDGPPIRGFAMTDAQAYSATRPRAVRWAQGRCPECGYDLVAIDFCRCPECGFGFSRRTPAASSAQRETEYH